MKFVICAVAALLVPTSTLAQRRDGNERPRGERPADMLAPSGLGLSLGGGVTDFVDGDTNDFTRPGGGWEARLTYGTHSLLALEAAYIGSAQDIDALGLTGTASLLGNGLEANLRLNMTTTGVQPYVFVGAGWTNYRIVNQNANTSSLRGEDDIVHVPVGVGIGYRLQKRLTIDVRGTYRVAFDDELMDAAFANSAADGDLDSLTVGARLGWEF